MKLTAYLSDLVKQQEIAGGILIVRKDGREVFHQSMGYADIENRLPITDQSIFRMMSMSKVITAVGVMKLVEEGIIGLDDPVSRFIPAFRNQSVVQDERYVYSPDMNQARLFSLMQSFDLKDIRTIPAEREITIRDLLSHSSGLEQGMVGLLAMMKNRQTNETLAQEVEKYAVYPLDFQPGKGTGYSPIAGFDLLLRVCEIVSGDDAAVYLQKNIFDPLDMKDTGFSLTGDQKERLVRVYKKQDEHLIDVTDTPEDMDGMLHRGPLMTSGSGGIYATAIDYEHFVQMLCDDGLYQGKRILKQETVTLMRQEAPAVHLEPEPGMVWGLGVRIRQDPNTYGNPCTPGTYGWSGAFGTHFFVSPADHLEAIWCTNRSDAGGSGFPVSQKIEKLIFESFADCDAER